MNAKLQHGGWVLTSENNVHLKGQPLIYLRKIFYNKQGGLVRLKISETKEIECKGIIINADYAKDGTLIGVEIV